jgi:hypothetical protein
VLVLLADAARQARTAGLRVLQVTGRESETLTTSLGAIAGGMGTRIGLIRGGCLAAVLPGGGEGPVGPGDRGEAGAAEQAGGGSEVEGADGGTGLGIADDQVLS